MRILIADDHALFRRGLSLLLHQLYPDAELAEAIDIAGALALGDRLAQCDVVLLDVTMPGMEGFAGVERLHAAAPAARIVMLSASADLPSIRKAMAAGARGYVLKSRSGETLRHAIALVMAGEVYVPPVVLAELDRPQGGSELPADSPLRSLTERQRQTLLLLVQGLSNKEIARQLGLLESTVKAHLKVILKKLGAGNRTQAALLATQMGLGRAG